MRIRGLALIIVIGILGVLAVGWHAAEAQPDRPAWEEPLRAKLEQVVHFRFDAVPFKDGLEYLENQGRAAVNVDRAARKAVPGLDELLLTLESPEEGIRLDEALDRLTAAAGLAWELRDETIAITTRDRKGKPGAPGILPPAPPEALATIVHFRFDGVPFKDAREFLETQAHLDVEDLAIRATGDGSDGFPIHLQSPEEGMSLAAALSWLADAVGERWMAREGRVVLLSDRILEALQEQAPPVGGPAAAEIRETIGRLGDRSFAVREQASRRLLAWASDAPEQVLPLLPAETPDPEVRCRVEDLRRQVPWERLGRAELKIAAEDAALKQAVGAVLASPSETTLQVLIAQAGGQRRAMEVIAAYLGSHADQARAARALGRLAGEPWPEDRAGVEAAWAWWQRHRHDPESGGR